MKRQLPSQTLEEQLLSPATGQAPVSETIRLGAQLMLQKAVELEVSEFLRLPRGCWPVLVLRQWFCSVGASKLGEAWPVLIEPGRCLTKSGAGSNVGCPTRLSGFPIPRVGRCTRAACFGFGRPVLFCPDRFSWVVLDVRRRGVQSGSTTRLYGPCRVFIVVPWRAVQETGPPVLFLRPASARRRWRK